MKKLLILFVLWVGLMGEGWSQATLIKYQGYADQGNRQVSLQGFRSAEKIAQVFPGATVTVYETGTLTLASIYSDESATPKANPFTATSEGWVEFYIATGQYDIRYSGGGIVTPFTRSKVRIGLTPTEITSGIVDNTITVKGKGRRGERARYAIASLPTCDSSSVDVTVNVSDGNRGQRTCRNMTGSTYAWVDDDPVVRVSRFGVSTVATAANNVTNFTAALAVAAAGYPVVIIEEGTFNFNAELYVPTGIKIIGAGRNKTILQYTKATGSLFRATDYAVAQSNNVFEGFTAQATGSAINVNTTGIDMSSMNHSVIRECEIYNFGTQILFDAKRAGGSAVSTYYNNLYDTLVAMGSAGYAFTHRGVAVQSGANSNTFHRLKSSYLKYPIAIGDSANEAPNQTTFYSPQLESWETYALYAPKALGLSIYGGRYEGAHNVFNIGNSISNVQGVLIDAPYIEATATLIVRDTTNPTVTIRGGSYRGLFSDLGGGLSSAPSVNLAPNGLFEGWSSSTALLGWNKISGTSWVYGGTATTRESTVKKNGTYSVKVGDGSTSVGIATGNIYVDPTRPFTVSYWSAGSASVGHRLAVRFFNSSGTQITSWSDAYYSPANINGEGGTSGFSYSGSYNAWLDGADTTDTSTTFTRHARTFGIPATTAYLQVGLILTATVTNYAYFDDFQFTEGQAGYTARDVPLYAGGDQTIHGTLTASTITATGVAQGQTVKMLDGSQSIELKKTGSDSMIIESGTNRLRIAAYSTKFYRYDGTTLFGGFDENGYFSAGSRVGVGATLSLTNATVTATAGGTTTLDLSSGNIRTVTMPAGNTTLTASNVPVGFITIAIIQDATGARTVTWNSLFKFSAAVAPTLSIGAGKRDQFFFQCDGTNCYNVGSTLDVR